MNLTEQEEKQILALWETRMSTIGIANKIGLGRNEVGQYLKSQGLKSNGADDRTKSKRRQTAYKRIEEGAGVEVANAKNLKSQAVALGWKFCESGAQARVMQLIYDGPKTQAELMKSLNKPSSGVSYLLRQLQGYGLAEMCGLMLKPGKRKSERLYRATGMARAMKEATNDLS